MKIQITPEEAAEFTATLATPEYLADERDYKVAVHEVLSRLFAPSELVSPSFVDRLAAFFERRLDLNDLGMTSERVAWVEGAVADTHGVTNAFINLAGGRFAVNNFIWIPRTIRLGLGEEIRQAFQTLLDDGQPLAARVDGFQAELYAVEERAQATGEFEPNWSLVPITLAFVAAILGAYDPQRFTFYPATKLRRSYEELVGPWPGRKQRGGSRYELACEFVQSVRDELVRLGSPVQDMIDAQSFLWLRALAADGLEGSLDEQTEQPALASEDVHLVVKWSPRYGPDTVDRHIEVEGERGAVWWGLFAASGSEFRVSEQWTDQLHAQIDAGRDTFAFLVGPACYRTRLLDVQHDRADVEPELIPAYYRDNGGQYRLWVKLRSFEAIERDELYKLLDPVTQPGRPAALGNQTNPLFVRIRMTPRVWWVNLGESFQRARRGQYLWAPLLNKANRPERHWQTMRHVRVGDLVLNHLDGQIRAVSEVAAEAVPATRPDPEADKAWNDDGLRVALRWHDLPDAIDINEIPVEWRIAEQGSFDKNGAATQGYLFPVSDDFAEKLTTRFPELNLDIHTMKPFSGHDQPEADGHPKTTFDLETLQGRVAKRGLRISPDILASTLAALGSGKHVILTGPPGTAKTTLAEVVASLATDARLCSGYTLTTATADWTTYETIGGLHPTSQGVLSFQEGHFLEAIERNEWLVIDELNRSNFDRAFGQLFTVLSGQAVQLPYERVDGRGRIALAPEGTPHAFGHADTITIPRSWRILATMNVFDKSLLFEMSFALMRRFAFIEVPSPSPDDFLDLIDEQTNGDAEARNLAASFLPLRSVKDLGPAVFMDLARYVRERRAISQAGGDGQLAFEAFYGYLLPQFEGIDEVGGERLYKLVSKVVGPKSHERLRSTLRAVLGLELALPKDWRETETVEEFPEPVEIQVDELEED